MKKICLIFSEILLLMHFTVSKVFRFIVLLIRYMTGLSVKMGMLLHITICQNYWFITCINAYAIELKDAQREFTEKIKICRSRADIKKVLKKYIKTYMDQAENEKKQLSYLPVRKAMEYVENNYMDKIGLEEIAEYVGLNASYFSALFKKESGKTFLSYLTEIRINHAKEFLRTTNDTMGSIAEKVGYTDARYFSQCFEKIVGMKPSLFRKLYAK